MEYIGKLGGYIIYFHGKRWEHLMNKWGDLTIKTSNFLRS